MTNEIMQFSLTLEFLKACRCVLGDDSPAAIVGAIRADDQTDWNAIQYIFSEVEAEQADEVTDIRNVFIEACCRVLGEAYLKDPLKAMCDVMLTGESTKLEEIGTVFQNLLDIKQHGGPKASSSSASAFCPACADR
jgi:hypothetical protein